MREIYWLVRRYSKLNLYCKILIYKTTINCWVPMIWTKPDKFKPPTSPYYLGYNVKVLSIIIGLLALKVWRTFSSKSILYELYPVSNNKLKICNNKWCISVHTNRCRIFAMIIFDQMVHITGVMHRLQKYNIVYWIVRIKRFGYVASILWG